MAAAGSFCVSSRSETSAGMTTTTRNARTTIATLSWLPSDAAHAETSPVSASTLASAQEACGATASAAAATAPMPAGHRGDSACDGGLCSTGDFCGLGASAEVCATTRTAVMRAERGAIMFKRSPRLTLPSAPREQLTDDVDSS